MSYMKYISKLLGDFHFHHCNLSTRYFYFSELWMHTVPPLDVWLPTQPCWSTAVSVKFGVWLIVMSFCFFLQGDSEEFSSFITLVWDSNRNRLFQTGKIGAPSNGVIESDAPSMTISSKPKSCFQCSNVSNRIKSAHRDQIKGSH